MCESVTSHKQTVQSLKNIEQICNSTIDRIALCGLRGSAAHERMSRIRHEVRMLLVDQLRWHEDWKAVSFEIGYQRGII